MNRDHVVFAVCGLLLGLIIGTFVLGPKLALSKLEGTSAVPGPAEAAAAPSMPGDAADGGATAGGTPPAGGPMAAVMQRLTTLKDQIAKNPRDFDALAQLASMYMDVGKYPQAIGYFERALAVREDPAVRTDLGICYKQSGQPDKAIETLNRVAKEQPDEWQAVFNLAIVYAETHRPDQARVELARLKQMNADPAQVAKLEAAIAK